MHNALIALSGRDEWMAVITGVDKHIKPRVKPAYEQTGQIPNRFHCDPRQHRGGQDLFGFFGFNLSNPDTPV